MATTTVPAPAAARTRLAPATWTWTLLAAESIAVAIVLHLVVDIQSLNAELLFAVLFLGVGPLQVLFGSLAMRGVRPAVAVIAALGAVGLLLLYIATRSTPAPLNPDAGASVGFVGTQLFGMLILGCELLAIAGVGALLPTRLRRWSVNGLLGVGLAFWLVWFWFSFA